MRMVTQNVGMLMKISFPREALILAGLMEVLFNFCIRLVLIVPVFWIFDVPLSPSLVLPLGVGALILLGLAIGLLLTPMGVLYSDVGRGIAFLTTFWLFLTPVVYPPPQSGIAAYLTTINPVSPVIVTVRDWFIGQPPAHLLGLFVVTTAALVLVMIGLLIYHAALPHLIERMGS